MNQHAVMESPIGDIIIVRGPKGITRIALAHQRHLPELSSFGPRDDGSSRDAQEQLDQYFSGERVQFDLPLFVRGTPFQRSVWRCLSTIPYGTTWSYGQLARVIEQPLAARAVGLANGRNPHAIVVPCHRVIGANGSLTGYAGGVEAKSFLLHHESLRSRVDVVSS